MAFPVKLERGLVIVNPGGYEDATHAYLHQVLQRWVGCPAAIAIVYGQVLAFPVPAQTKVSFIERWSQVVCASDTTIKAASLPQPGFSPAYPQLRAFASPGGWSIAASTFFWAWRSFSWRCAPPPPSSWAAKCCLSSSS